jgi:K(+)-stimulated pyrophosphate-energized sodium pump
MNVSVRANVRTAAAARRRPAAGTRRGLPAGAITGMLVVGLGLLGVAGYSGPDSALAALRPAAAQVVEALWSRSLRRVADLDLRASRRRHLHQGADVGADLVGKVEAASRKMTPATRP